MVLRIGVRAGSFSEENLLASNCLLITLACIHCACQLLLLVLLVQMRVVHLIRWKHRLPCKSLSLLICLVIKLRCHSLAILSLRVLTRNWMVGRVNLTASLTIQFHLLASRARLSNCHSESWRLALAGTLSENRSVLTRPSLIRNDGICGLLVLPLLLHPVLLRIILSLLIHFQPLLTRT